ncbi:hypothetical protein Bca52824_060298 [Brassica carinata]|uniref:Profilin n=1 Tax=Brassica carinata TaxID=52824 RepID=A0A8X7R172_BRACI|nr:hypothetical protein Bca52824_060298 [Brassica carinata]
MSWQTYVDEHLMCDVGDGQGHHLTSAAIIGHDGSVWAQSANFPQFKPQEMTDIMKDFDEPGHLAPTGLFLAGLKYMVIQGEPGAVIRGKRYDYGGAGGITIKKTGQSMVFGLYEEPVLKKLEPWRDLKDKVVLVTGASSGIGKEICLDLGKAGCKIIAAARRVDRLKSLCSDINSFCSTGTQAASLKLDVASDAATIRKAVKGAWGIFGKIDVLINNAGIRGNVKSSLDLSEDEWDKVFRTNLTGPWLVSKYVCILMRDAKQVAYACSKGGVDIMTRMMAIELGVYKIRVNSIAPGLFKSEITQGLMQKEWLKKVNERTVPLKMQQSVDPGLTSLVRYLIHDSSQYVSGNTYIVDSGASLPGLPIFSSL